MSQRREDRQTIMRRVQPKCAPRRVSIAPGPQEGRDEPVSRRETRTAFVPPVREGLVLL